MLTTAKTAKTDHATTAGVSRLTTLAIPTNRTTAHRATGWDPAAILTLGTTGCTLSYDVLKGGR